jgi:hypothetical protein
VGPFPGVLGACAGSELGPEPALLPVRLTEEVSWVTSSDREAPAPIHCEKPRHPCFLVFSGTGGQEVGQAQRLDPQSHPARLGSHQALPLLP